MHARYVPVAVGGIYHHPRDPHRDPHRDYREPQPTSTNTRYPSVGTRNLGIQHNNQVASTSQIYAIPGRTARHPMTAYPVNQQRYSQQQQQQQYYQPQPAGRQQQLTARQQRQIQHRSLDIADIYAMDGFAPGTSGYLQPAGTTDFPVYPTTSTGNPGVYGAQPSSARYGAPSHSHYGGQPLPYTSAPPTQPLNVSTTGLTGLAGGPLSGPGAYGLGGSGTQPLSIHQQNHSAQQNPWTTSAGAQQLSTSQPPPIPAAPMASSQFSRDPYSMPVPTLQREYDMLRREYENSIQKLNTTMNSIKTFWSPELKRERALRKDESAKSQMLQEQLRMASQDNQKSATTLRQLQRELQCQYDLQRSAGGQPGFGNVSRDDYEAVRMERDRIHRELQLTKETVRELQMQNETHRQTVMGRDESIRKLLDMLQSKGMMPYNAGQEQMELEHCKAKLIEFENRCQHLEASIRIKEQDIRALQDECMGASEKLRQAQRQNEWLQKAGMAGAQAEDHSAMQAMLETKDSRIMQLEKQMQFYEEDVRLLRDQLQNRPREFTDKTVSTSEYQEVKLKMEKAELELQAKQSELESAQTRLMTVEDQLRDIKKHHTILKETCNAKEQQLNLMQGDIEALRSKLEAKNETIEHKQSQVQQALNEANKNTGDLADLRDQLKIKDGKIQMFQRKVEGLEELVREKDMNLDDVRSRMQNMPAMQKQKELQEQIEEMIRERDRISRDLREQRDLVEQERLEALEVHRRETRDLRMAIDSLQKEIRDRQVLIESQNESISDLNRENAKLRRQIGHADLTDADRTEIDQLRAELDEARGEVDKLLRMVKELEKERDQLATAKKELQKQADEVRRSGRSTGGYTDTVSTYRRAADEQNMKQKDQRIQELEEALRESVSITADRELAINQQKNMSTQQEMQLNAYKEQLTALQNQYQNVAQHSMHVDSTAQDKDAIIRALRRERHKMLEDYLQIKQDYLQASINEKDARIGLLEVTNRDPDQVHTIKRQKEKLMRRLKDENDRRLRLLAESKTEMGDVGSLMKDMKSSPLDQGDDDAEGIWA